MAGFKKGDWLRIVDDDHREFRIRGLKEGSLVKVIEYDPTRMMHRGGGVRLEGVTNRPVGDYFMANRFELATRSFEQAMKRYLLYNEKPNKDVFRQLTD
jgi:hypothetical protein